MKNSHKNWSKYYNEVADNLNEPFTKNLDTHCWLLDFINYVCKLNKIQSNFEVNVIIFVSIINKINQKKIQLFTIEQN